MKGFPLKAIVFVVDCAQDAFGYDFSASLALHLSECYNQKQPAFGEFD